MNSRVLCMKCFILSSNVQYTQKLYMRYKTNTGLLNSIFIKKLKQNLFNVVRPSNLKICQIELDDSNRSTTIHYQRHYFLHAFISEDNN